MDARTKDDLNRRKVLAVFESADGLTGHQEVPFPPPVIWRRGCEWNHDWCRAQPDEGIKEFIASLDPYHPIRVALRLGGHVNVKARSRCSCEEPPSNTTGGPGA